MDRFEHRMVLKSLVPWFGAKRTLAPKIVRLLGKHTAYWEPFCGSMAVLMAKPPCRNESVNDLHGDLINLAKVIQHPQLGPALYRRLRRVLMCEDLVREAKTRVRHGPLMPPLQRAFYYFIDAWLGRNGVAGTHSTNGGFSRRFTDRGGSSAVRLASAVRSIPAWRKRLSRVTILRCDAFEILGRICDQPGMAIYCDPPYLEKGARYMHDFTDVDHDRLAASLHRFRRARIVLSYYEHDRLEELYPDWTRHRIEVTKKMTHAGHQGRRGSAKQKVVEVLLTNWDSRNIDAPLFDNAQ